MDSKAAACVREGFFYKAEK